MRYRHTVRGAVGADASVHLQLRGTGERADRDFSTFPAERIDLPAYTLVGVGVDLRALEAHGNRPALHLTLRADNLLDEEYEEVLGFRAPGRHLELTARVAFGGR